MLGLIIACVLFGLGLLSLYHYMTASSHLERAVVGIFVFGCAGSATSSKSDQFWWLGGVYIIIAAVLTGFLGRRNRKRSEGDQ
jgi:uncharacterized membrane protein YdjX (TVP38/TMEM64 family)